MLLFQVLLTFLLSVVEAQDGVNSLDGSITIPALGRAFTLGSFYDVRQDQLVAPGLSLWDEATLQNNKMQQDMPYTEAIINAETSFQSRASSFDMSVGLKASFCSGLVEVQGSANYLRSESASNKEVSVALTYKTRTHMESLTMEQLGHGNIQYPYLFDEVQEATHVVTKIEYGAGAVFQFKKQMTEHDQRKDIQGSLDIAVKLVVMSAEGHGKLNLTEKEKKNLESLSCKFNGDVRLMNPPTTWSEAVQVYRDLPKMINKSTVIPVKVHLYPLAKLDSKGQRLVRQISVTLLQEVSDRMEDYSNLQRGVGDLRLTESYGKLFYFKKQVEDFMSAVEVHRDVFSRGLALLLPKIRGQGSEEAKLIDLLHKPGKIYSMNRLADWIRWRKMEAGAVKSLIRLNPSAWVTKPGDFMELLFDEKNKHILALNLGLYFQEDSSTGCINVNCTEQKKEVVSWLKSPARTKFLHKSNIVQNFVKNNGWSKPDGTLFVIKENLYVKDAQNVELNYYAKQELVEQDLEKLPGIKDILVKKETCSFTSVEWEVDMTSPYLNGFHILWRNQTQSSGDVTEWNQLQATEANAIVPSGGFDLDFIVQAKFDFGNGHQNFSFQHSTSMSDCHLDCCPKGAIKAGTGTKISFSPSDQDPLGEGGLALASCTDPSFTFVGKQHSTCTMQGWVPSALGHCIPPKVVCKRKDLAVPSGVSASFIPDEDPMQEGNAASASCPSGSVLVGQAVATCSKNGWIPKSLGICKPLSIESLNVGVGFVNCKTSYTGCTDGGGGHMFYLDRQNVKCPAGQVLAQFFLRRCANNQLIHYQFTCCNVGFH